MYNTNSIKKAKYQTTATVRINKNIISTPFSFPPEFYLFKKIEPRTFLIQADNDFRFPKERLKANAVEKIRFPENIPNGFPQQVHLISYK